MATYNKSKSNNQLVVDQVISYLMSVGQLLEIYESVIKGNDSKKINSFRNALTNFRPILDKVEDDDWSGVVFDLSKKLETDAESKKIQQATSRSLSLIGTLLSMYKAKDQAEAKNKFKELLDKESAREQRFSSGWTGDITALLGIQGSWAHNMGNEKDGPGYGLFVPVGLQIAKKNLGVMVYPIDLGGYVSKTNGDDSKTRVQNALRSGVTAYWRFSASVPVVLGAALDYLPPWETRNGVLRAIGYLGIELPLFAIW